MSRRPSVRSRLRPAALAVIAVAALPVLAGCATSPGAAAVVGQQRISVATLQNQVNAALADPKAQSQFGSDRATFTREVLAHLISVDVYSAAAKAKGVTLTPAEVDSETQSYVQQAGSLTALQQQAAQGGVPAGQLPSYIRGAALQTKLTQSLVSSLPVSQAQLQAEYTKEIASFDQVHAAHILVKSKKLATHLLQQVKANPSSFAGLAQKYSTDTGSASKGGDLGFVGKGQTVAPFDKALFTDKVGSYDLVHSQYGYHVVHVIARRTASLAQVTPQLKQSLFASQGTALLARLVESESRTLGIHVSPRYGRWDPAKATVDAVQDPVSSSG